MINQSGDDNSKGIDGDEYMMTLGYIPNRWSEL